jgi:hypothetical protein
LHRCGFLYGAVYSPIDAAVHLGANVQFNYLPHIPERERNDREAVVPLIWT